MFSGIIYNQGKVKSIRKSPRYVEGSRVIEVSSDIRFQKNDIGESVCCDGVCLTLITLKNKILEFYLSNETLNRTKFKKIKKGDLVNLELPLKKGQNISGHICQGHVDTTSKVVNIKKRGASRVLEFSVNKKYKKLLIEKASILINGVSLTISKITKKGFEIWLIPHTLKLTNLSNIKIKTVVNIEFDILSKYIKNYLL